MPLDPDDIDTLRLACAHIYDAWMQDNLQPGRGETEWPGPEQKEMVHQVREEWMDITGLPLGELSWKRARIIREWIRYRKKTEEQKAVVRNSEQRTLFPDPQGGVYFWEELDTGNIKIGYTSGPFDKRERSMKGNNSSPVRLRGWMPGTKQHERALHITFAGYRIFPNREWFRPNKQLFDFIKANSTCN